MCSRVGDEAGGLGLENGEREVKICSQHLHFSGWSGLQVPREFLLKLGINQLVEGKEARNENLCTHTCLRGGRREVPLI